jgi:hypothetical protein
MVRLSSAPQTGFAYSSGSWGSSRQVGIHPGLYAVVRSADLSWSKSWFFKGAQTNSLRYLRPAIATQIARGGSGIRVATLRFSTIGLGIF